MSYAYARRVAAAGLFLQDIFSEDDYIRACIAFKRIQMETYTHIDFDEKNVYFQEKCADESIEFLMSYDNRLTKNFASVIVTLIENTKDKSTLTKIYDYEMLVKFIECIISKLDCFS